MSIYVVSKEINRIIANDNKIANFGLWYNKFFPVSEGNFKPCNDKNNEKKAIEYYKTQYQKIINDNRIIELLRNKNLELYHLSEYYKRIGYKKITATATLKTPLIIGLGETHPVETGLLFHHTIGIPYIPSSSIKGLVRFQYILKLWEQLGLKENDKGAIVIPDDPNDKDQQNEVLNFVRNFGSTKYRGRVIFLDAFPVKVPELIVDILNPHYGAYYQGKEAPADYLSPKPINFLAIKPGSKFVFRFLIPTDGHNNDIEKFFIEILKRALAEEGLGAKTALGYGRFRLGFEEPDELSALVSNQHEKNYESVKKTAERNLVSEEMELKNEIQRLRKRDNIRPVIGEIWSKLRDNKEKYSKEIYILFKNKLKEIGEWEPKGNKRIRTKMQERKDRIDRILKEKETKNG